MYSNKSIFGFSSVMLAVSNVNVMCVLIKMKTCTQILVKTMLF